MIDPPAALAEKPAVRLLLASPRGFCAGVRRAINAVRDALAVHGAPVYVRHAIVHNMEVVRELEAEGAIFVDELDEVPAGSVILFSAHGVPPSVAAEAGRRGLTAYDAVCPLVAKVHREVERHDRQGRDVLLVGHAGHAEVEGTLGRLSNVRGFVVNTPEDIRALPLTAGNPVAYAVQTTYSVDDASEVVDSLTAYFADIVGPASSDICYATTNRQAATRLVAAQADAVIVIGEKFSSNACRLAEVAGQDCDAVQLIASPTALDWSLLPAAGTIGITAAASTPETSVRKVIMALSARYALQIEEMVGPSETATFRPLAIA